MPRVFILCPVADGAKQVDTGLIVADRASLDSLDHLLVACPHCGDCHAIVRPFLEGDRAVPSEGNTGGPTTARVVLDMVVRQEGGYAEPAWVLEPIDYNKVPAGVSRPLGEPEVN